jgi:hypothetical protein
MKTFLKMMKKKSNGIPEEKLQLFDEIISTYFVPGRGSTEGDCAFMRAIGENFTEEQRFRLWEQNGGCEGSGREKARKKFAAEHADKPLSVRLDLYIMDFVSEKTQSIVLDEKNKTIAYTYACGECYNHTVKGKLTAPFDLYYESCAGGRLKNLQSALGIKLKIKSVDIPENGVSSESPCVFTFDITEG